MKDKDITLKVELDTVEAEAKLKSLLERAEKVKASLHEHDFKPLSGNSIFCKCGETRTAPTGYYYTYNPHPTYTPFVSVTGTTSNNIPATTTILGNASAYGNRCIK